MKKAERQCSRRKRRFAVRLAVLGAAMAGIFFVPQPVCAAQQDTYNLEEELLSELPVSEIQDVLNRDDSTSDLSFSEILHRVLEADGATDKREIAVQILHLVTGDMAEYKTLFVQLLLVTAAFAFLHNFMNVFENGQISKTCFYLYFLVLMTLLMKSYLLIHDLLGRVLDTTVDFMEALLPAFCMTMVFSSSQVTAAAFYQLSLIVIYLVERVLTRFVVPGIHIYVVLQMLNYMTGEKLISRLTGLLKSVLTWGMRILLAGVTGMNMVENMIAPSLDNLKKMSVTKTISMIPGLGNTAEAVGNIFFGSAIVIKNGVGVTALILLMCICMGPLIKMTVFAFLYQSAGANVQPFADKRVCGCISSVGDGAMLLFRALLTGVLLFMITIAIVVTAIR